MHVKLSLNENQSLEKSQEDASVLENKTQLE